MIIIKLKYLYTTKTRGIEGVLKNPEDFIVKEVIDNKFFSKYSRQNKVKILEGKNSLVLVKKRNMTIVGEKNTIVFDDIVEKKIALVNNLNKKIIYPPFPKESPLSKEISSFVGLIENKEKTNKSSLRMGLDVVKVIEACEESIGLGGRNIKIK